MYDKQGPGSVDDTTVPPSRNGYTWDLAPPPEACEVAEGTAKTGFGKWYEATGRDSCASNSMKHGITNKLLRAANPSLGTCASECEANLASGKAYCVQRRYG